MTSYFSSFFYAVVQAVQDFFRIRTWFNYAKLLLSTDGAVLIIAYSAMGGLLIDSKYSVSFRFLAPLLLGAITMPSWLRWSVVGAARSVMVRFHSLPERHWPKLSTIFFEYYLPSFVFAITAAILLLLMPRAVQWLVGPILVIVAAFLFSHPIFKLTTSLFLAKEDAQRLLDTGRLNEKVTDAFTDRRLLVSTILFLSLCIATSWGVGWLSEAINDTATLSNFFTVKVFLLNVGFGLVISIFCSLVITNLYLPPLAELLSDELPPETSGKSGQSRFNLWPKPAISPRATRYWLIAVCFAVLCIGLYSIRYSLLHLYLNGDAEYRRVTQTQTEPEKDLDEKIFRGLINYACIGDIRRIRLIFTFGINAKQWPMGEVLSCAVINEKTEIVDYLIGQGVDVNSTFRAGYHRMNDRGDGTKGTYNLADIDAFLRNGADPKIAADRVATPLDFAAANKDFSMIRRLINAGATVNPASGEPPIFYFARGVRTEFGAQGDVDWKKSLRNASAAGLLLNARDVSGKTLLHWAAGYRDEKLINTLLDLGFSTQQQDNRGGLPFMHFVWSLRESDEQLQPNAQKMLTMLMDGVQNVNQRTRKRVRGEELPKGWQWDANWLPFDWAIADVAPKAPWLRHFFSERIDYSRVSVNTYHDERGSDDEKRWIRAFIEDLSPEQLKSMPSFRIFLRSNLWFHMEELYNTRSEQLRP